MPRRVVLTGQSTLWLVTSVGFVGCVGDWEGCELAAEEWMSSWNWWKSVHVVANMRGELKYGIINANKR